MDITFWRRPKCLQVFLATWTFETIEYLYKCSLSSKSVSLSWAVILKKIRVSSSGISREVFKVRILNLFYGSSIKLFLFPCMLWNIYVNSKWDIIKEHFLVTKYYFRWKALYLCSIYIALVRPHGDPHMMRFGAHLVLVLRYLLAEEMRDAFKEKILTLGDLILHM